MTKAEIILWSRLRMRKVEGLKFRRQQPIFDYIVDFLGAKNIETVEAYWEKTLKNEQVKCFYEALGFEVISDHENLKKYVLQLPEYKHKKLDYMEVRYGTEN